MTCRTNSLHRLALCTSARNPVLKLHQKMKTVLASSVDRAQQRPLPSVLLVLTHSPPRPAPPRLCNRAPGRIETP